jgi:hypothetical protein
METLERHPEAQQRGLVAKTLSRRLVLLLRS